MLYRLFLILLPVFLHASWTDWFFGTQQPQAKEFKCPHNCGEWGSESIQKVEWQGVLVLYELDKMNHDYNKFPFPYSSPPRSKEDPWYKDILHSRAVEIKPYVNYNSISTCYRFHYLENSEKVFKCCCKSSYYSNGHCWELFNSRTTDGKKTGLGFYHCYVERGVPYEVHFEYIDREGLPLERFHESSFFFDSIPQILSFSEEVSENIFEALLESRHRSDFVHLSSLEQISECLDDRIKDNRQKVETLEIDINNCKPHERGLIKNLESLKGHHEKCVSVLNTKINEVEKEKSRLEAEAKRCDSIYSLYFPLINQHLTKLLDEYTSIWDHCIEHHQAPSSFLERSRIHYKLGNNIECIDDIKKLFEICPAEMISDEISEELERTKGIAECEIGLYDEAILTLSNYMKNHPHYKEDYLERAIAYFETGDLQHAIEDFARSGFSADPIHPNFKDDIDLATGFIKGLSKGAFEGTIETSHLVGTTLWGLPKGLWALATNPEEVSLQMCRAFNEAIHYIRSEGIHNVLYQMYPEAKELFHKGNQLSYMEQGVLMGKIAGKVGIEFALFKGTQKGVKVYRNLRKANAALTLNRMSTSVQAEQLITAYQREWWGKTAPLIEQLKTTKRLDKELYKAFRNQHLSEHQIRQVLHQAGIKTYPRPKGIPKNWETTLSKRKGGIKYQQKVIGKDGIAEIKTEVRVMPGDPNSKWLSQREPYVVHKSNGQTIDIYGSAVPKDSAPAHIPLKKYNYKKLSKSIPND